MKNYKTKKLIYNKHIKLKRQNKRKTAITKQLQEETSKQN